MDTHRGCCQAGQRTVVKVTGQWRMDTHRGNCQAAQRTVVNARGQRGWILIESAVKLDRGQW